MNEASDVQPTQSMLDGWVEEGSQLTDLLVPAEFNHEVFPLASTAMDPDEKLLTHTIRTVLPDGRTVERTLEVEGSPRLGLPGLFDQEVYAGIMALVERKGGMPEDGRVRFSFYELKEILGMSTNAENYRRLKDSLLRWQRTGLTSQGAVYLADSEEYAHGEAYNIWAVQWARDSRPGRAKRDLNEVKFHEYFIRNYRAGYIKSIDWDFWLSLGRGIRGMTLKRLYRLIDAERAGTLEWRTTVQNMMSQLPIPPSYHFPGKARRYLERHHPDLIERGFLRDVQVDSDHGILYKVEPRFANRQKHLGLADDARDRTAIERLISFGVRESTSRYLVALRGADVCQRYMDALPYQKKISNGAGWLNTYIMGNENGPYPPKQGFAPSNGEHSAEEAAGVSKTDAVKESDGRSHNTSEFREGYEWLFNKRDLTQATPEDQFFADEELSGSASEEGGSPGIFEEDVRLRAEAGEFDSAIEAFESVPFDQYKKYVNAPSPVQADETDNRYYLSSDDHLYVYLGGTEESDCYFLKLLHRSDDRDCVQD